MKSYHSALSAATELVNMPDPESKPARFIEWAEDICGLIAAIYERDFDTVTEDFQEKLGLLSDDE